MAWKLTCSNAVTDPTIDWQTSATRSNGNVEVAFAANRSPIYIGGGYVEPFKRVTTFAGETTYYRAAAR